MKAVCNTVLLILITSLPGFAQTPADTVDQKKIKRFVIVSGALYTTSLVALNQLWYADSEKQPFTFFNDNNEWKQVDKVGHFFSAFHISSGTSQLLQWSSLPKRKADLWGAVTGFAVLLPIEIMDGFSADYGASWGDLVANLAGSTFYFSQARAWNEIRIQPKFSFHRTPYPDLRTDGVLGNGLASELVKDYNGQTYWLSVNLNEFFRFPKWLNLAVGYGAEEMVYATDEANSDAGYHAYRQFYVGIDIDVSHLRSKFKAINTLLFFVNMIKLPAPALEFSRGRVHFQPFQF
jgi:hypothetical protein